MPLIFDLLEHEGLCMGGSTGINVAGAIRLAKDMGPGHTIVTVLADFGTRYQSKLFNPHSAREGTACPGMAGAAHRHKGAVRKADLGLIKARSPADRLPVSRRFVSEGMRATVIGLTEAGGVVLDRTVFYAASGGQPADRGVLTTATGDAVPIDGASYADANKTEIAHLPVVTAVSLKVGEPVHALIDWDLRYARMRMHTALHLLSAVLPYPVTGGAVGDKDGRLDFDIPEAGLDKDDITRKLADMIAAGAEVRSCWITDEELAAQPGLIKTMSVKPPVGTGRVG